MCVQMWGGVGVLEHVHVQARAETLDSSAYRLELGPVVGGVGGAQEQA
jgi:hypothetical protein